MMICAIKDCLRKARKVVALDFINDEGKKAKDIFGYCNIHWEDVRSYYYDKVIKW